MRFMKIGKQKGATFIYEVAPLLCVLSLPLFDQITDLRGKLCVVLIGAAFAGLDKGEKCFCGCKEFSIDSPGSGRTFRHLLSANGLGVCKHGHSACHQIILCAAVGCFCVVAHLSQQLLENHTGCIIAVIDKNRLRLFFEPRKPSDQACLVCVTAGAVERGDLRIDRNILTEQPDILCAVLELSAKRPLCLITYKQNSIFPAPKVML